ncbi:MAG: hypothetical protein ABUT20_53090, partial [Bacteroidota bacterium]
LFFLKGDCFLYGQEFLSKEFVIKVKTDNGWIKGTLANMSDSSISLLYLNKKEQVTLPITTIYCIKVKRPFLKTVLTDAFVLSFLGGMLVANYYIKRDFYTPGDPSFGTSLWTTMTAGAGAGLLVGCAQSAFVKVNIPVKKMPLLFREKKYRLAKYVAY